MSRDDGRAGVRTEYERDRECKAAPPAPAELATPPSVAQALSSRIGNRAFGEIVGRMHGDGYGVGEMVGQRDRSRRQAPEQEAADPLATAGRPLGAGLHRALATSQRRQLSRFGSMEHKVIGDRGSEGTTMQLGADLTITFGDMTAMAGDYFGSVQELRELAGVPGSPTAPFSMPGTVDEIKYVLFVEIQRSMQADQFDPAVRNAAKRRYYRLASQNASHFTRPELGDEFLSHEELAGKGTANNAGSYRANHELAIETAVAAGSGQCEPLDEAMLYESFASHFLTDAYAGGHTRTPRTSISDWWNPKVPMFWHNLKLWLAENIATHLNDNSLAGIMTVNYLWHQAIGTLDAMMEEKGADLTFGDAIAGALHDLDNVEGVEAQVGDQIFTLVGDGELLDDRDRELVRGAETLKLAAAGLKVSLKEVRDAYEYALDGCTDPDAVKDALKTPDGLYKAEQLWPRALPDDQSSNPTLPWMVATVDELLENGRIQEALTHFANEQADTLGGEVELEGDWKLNKETKEAALRWTLAKLKQDRSGVMRVFREIIDYTPGLVTAGAPDEEGELTGLFNDTADDNAREYYAEAKSKEALPTLTIAQRERLIRLALDGPTLDDDETMVVELLSTNLEHIAPVLDSVGWRAVWEDLHGEQCGEFVKAAGPTFWAKETYARKRDEIAWLAGGVTGEAAEETIIVILRTCTPAEVRQIDREVGGVLGLSWDLDGAEQDEFDRLSSG